MLSEMERVPKKYFRGFETISLVVGRLGGLPWYSAGKQSACNSGDLGLVPELGRSPRGGHGNPL